MEDLNDKVTGSTLTAVEFNQPMSEIQNVIENTGQGLTSSDLNQLGKGIAQYSANGDFYTDSGSANTYTLATIGLKQSSTAYIDGMRVRFIAANPSTAASTVNVNSLGVKDIFFAGAAVSGGEVSGVVELVFSLSNDRFDVSGSGFVVVTVITVSDPTFTPNPLSKSIEFTPIGGGAGGGGADGQGAGTSAAGAGGGAGSTAVLLTSTIDATYAITIGAGGSGGAGGGGADGSAGGATTVISSSVNISCGGGSGGQGMTGTSGNRTATGGTGSAVSTGGDLNVGGGSGSSAIVLSGDHATLGDGSGSSIGGQTRGKASSSGEDSAAFGGGGSGGGSEGAATNSGGGDGEQGVVIIKEFY